MRVPDWRFEIRRPHPFKEAARSGPGQPQGGDAGAGIGPGRQVPGHGEGLRRQGREAHLVAPTLEDAPLGTVDPAGVVREDRFQVRGDTLVGGA